ncbi:hypothetical protein PVC01_050027400, partial [Plasmodium vivax]
LYDAELYDAELYDAELYDAELYDAELYDAELYSAELTSTDKKSLAGRCHKADKHNARTAAGMFGKTTKLCNCKDEYS